MSNSQSIEPAAELSADDLRFLREAADYLEQPRFLIKVANLVGKPVEALLSVLPQRTTALVGELTQAALERSLDWAVRSLPSTDETRRKRWRAPGGQRFHTAMTATTGAVGGMFGLAGAGLELPATTTLMLRSIAEIAAKNGSFLADPEVRLQCLSVFSIGSPRLEAMESAYFSSRLTLAMAVRDAAQFLAKHSAQEIGRAVSEKSAPVLVRLVHQIASRFQIVVTEKLAAQTVPMAGAAMGSLVNAAFTDHFNRVAEFHFGIIALERRFGQAAVQAAYEQALERTRQARR